MTPEEKRLLLMVAKDTRRLFKDRAFALPNDIQRERERDYDKTINEVEHPRSMSVDWGTGKSYSVEQEFGVGPDGKPVSMGCGVVDEHVERPCKICGGAHPAFVPDPERPGAVIMTPKTCPEDEEWGEPPWDELISDVAELQEQKKLEGYIVEACGLLGLDLDRYKHAAISAYYRWRETNGHVIPYLSESKMVDWFKTCISQLHFTDEQAKIAKSVRDDAESATMEELEAGAQMYDKIIESQSIEDIEASASIYDNIDGEVPVYGAPIPIVPEYGAPFESDDKVQCEDCGGSFLESYCDWIKDKLLCRSCSRILEPKYPVKQLDIDILDPVDLEEVIDLLSLVIEPDQMPTKEQLNGLRDTELRDIMCWAAGVHAEASDNSLEQPMGAAPKGLRDLLPEDSHYKNWRLDDAEKSK